MPYMFQKLTSDKMKTKRKLITCLYSITRANIPKPKQLKMSKIPNKSPIKSPLAYFPAYPHTLIIKAGRKTGRWNYAGIGEEEYTYEPF